MARNVLRSHSLSAYVLVPVTIPVHMMFLFLLLLAPVTVHTHVLVPVPLAIAIVLSPLTQTLFHRTESIARRGSSLNVSSSQR